MIRAGRGEREAVRGGTPVRWAAAFAAIAVLVAMRPVAVRDVVFESVVHGPPVEYRGVSRGAAWGDFDGDGDPDLFVTHPTYDGPAQQNALYRNEGGRFVPLAWPATRRPPDGWEGAAWVDVDGDGDLDLHAVGRNGTGSMFLENQGVEGLAPLPADPFAEQVVSASMSCWADADGDGHLDVFVVGYGDDTNALFRNLGDWRFTEIPLPEVAGGGGASRACIWTDLDGDRLPELVVANARQPNLLLRNRGGLVLETDTTTALQQDTGYGYGLSSPDVDGDGLRDVFVANFDSDNTLLLGRPDGGLTPVARGATPQSAASKGHAWGDYDLDGTLDLYLGSGTPAPRQYNRLHLGGDEGAYRTSEEGSAATDADTSAAVAAADYDRDGDLDLFVANWGSPDSLDRLYRNTTSGRHWLMIELVGAQSNRMGVGARASVRVSDAAGARWMHRWLDTSTGYAGQNEPLLHFGLGAVPVVDSVVVSWPSGVVDRYGEMPADQRIRVREGG